MLVTAINGSPRFDGNTACAIEIALAPLKAAGIETRVVNVGGREIRGCMACNYCRKEGSTGCIFGDEPFTEFSNAMYESDGIILASPTYFAGVAGTMKCFLDRAFFVGRNKMRGKVGGVIAIDRRAGSMLTYDQLAHYITISDMYLASSQYWTMARGLKPGDVKGDEEGVRIMTRLGENIAYMLEKL